MILVTGASGTLGKEISRQLAQKKHNFKCLVRETSKVKEREEMRATLFYGDVTDRKSLKKAMEGVKNDIQGFVDAFSRDSTCDNEPLLKTFDIKLRTFKEYLREFFIKGKE